MQDHPDVEAAITYFTDQGNLRVRRISTDLRPAALDRVRHRVEGVDVRTRQRLEPGAIDEHVVADHRRAPVNAIGYLRVMLTVDDIDDALAAWRHKHVLTVERVMLRRSAISCCNAPAWWSASTCS